MHLAERPARAAANSNRNAGGGGKTAVPKATTQQKIEYCTNTTKHYYCNGCCDNMILHFYRVHALTFRLLLI